MKKHIIYKGVFLLLSLSLIVACSKNELSNQATQTSLNVLKSKSVNQKDSVNVKVSVFASNIAFPRGLKFGPDGYLYVALAGFGGTDSTIGKCTQVVPPIGPYKGGHTSKIIKISPDGTVSTVADGFPSQKNALGFTSGVSDVEFAGDKLYATLVAGCSHGNADFPTSLISVNRKTGKWKVVADLSFYYHNNPVLKPEADDFEPDGDPYSLIYVDQNFYAIEPNHGEMVKITPSGTITRVVDFSAHFGHIVPTVVAFNKDFYVGNLRTFPLVADSSAIYKVTLNGDVSIYAGGFTGVLGVAFDHQKRLYVLETSAGGGPTPMTGRVVRINKDNSRTVIVDKLFFPTGMTFGPDGALYISNTGFGPPTGQILKVVLKDNHFERPNDDHNDNGNKDNHFHDD
jgi:hypothetical protein